MKGSKEVDMTLNIGGEIIRLTADFDQQNIIREAEMAVKQYFNRLRKEWPDSSDRKILAMAAFEFSLWHKQLLKIQEEAIGMVDDAARQIREFASEPED